MNIQQVDVGKEVSQAALEQELSVLHKQPDEKAQQAAGASDGNGDDPKGNHLSREDAEKLSQQAQSYFNEKGFSLEFKVLGDSDKMVQMVVQDAQSHKVIRKIPEDELVKLSDNLKRMAKGVLDKSV